MEVEGSQIRLYFDHVDGGLTAKGSNCLKGFEIAGSDSDFVPAEAKIDGNQVIVWQEKITEPKQVRYAWADNPAEANLYNQAGLPASPFRTNKF
jgi:sialate O-acetylesterase